MASQHVRQMVSAGWAFMRAGNARGAVREFRSALAADPDNHEALAGLCQCHLDASELKEADEEANALLRLAPDSAVAHRIKSEVFRRKRQRGKALEFARQAVKLEPDEPIGYHILALVHFDQKDYRAALKVVASGREVTPDHAVLAAQQALILFEMKGGKAAWPAAEEALQLGMGDDYVLTIVARIAIARGRLEQAQDLLAAVLQRNANDEEAISLYLLTNPSRYGLLRGRLQFPSWRKEQGVFGWIVWSGVWILLLAIAIALVAGTHVPGIAIGLGYRFFWQAQYMGHRREVKKHFAQPALRSGY